MSVWPITSTWRLGQTCPDGYTCKCILQQSYLSPPQKTFGSNILEYKIQKKNTQNCVHTIFWNRVDCTWIQFMKWFTICPTLSIVEVIWVQQSGNDSYILYIVENKIFFYWVIYLIRIQKEGYWDSLTYQWINYCSVSSFFQ